MKKIYFLFILFTGICSFPSHGTAIIISKAEINATSIAPLPGKIGSSSLTLNEPPVKKLSFIEKLKLKLIQKNLKKQFQDDGEPTPRQKKQGKLSMIFGIGSLVVLLIPYVGILALPAAITALVLGLKSIKGNSNTRGIVGIITGAVTLLLFIVAIILVAAFLSGWN